MLQNEKVSVYYGTKEIYEFEKQYKRIDENALYFIEGILYSGYELYSQDYKKVSNLPDVGQKNYIYINTTDSSVTIWDEKQNEWIYICKPINNSAITNDDSSIATSSVVYKSLEEANKYTDDKYATVIDTIEATIENSIFENNLALFLGTSDKYNSIADITNVLDSIQTDIEADLSNIYTKNEVDNKFSTLETNIDWKEAVETYNDISTTYPAPADGWTVNVKDTDYTYRYNGTSWIAISANAIPKATQTVDGLFTKEDKTKLDSIVADANKTVVDDALNSASTNPVQNSVVYNAIKNLTTIKNVSVQTNINFNDITIPGLFQYAIQCTTEERNAPELNTVFYIYNICRDSSNMEQFAFAENKNKLFYRIRNDTKWGAWVQIITSEHISKNFTTEDWSQIAAAPLVKQLYEKIQDLESKITKIQNQASKIFDVPAKSSITLHMPNQHNLMLFYTHMVIPAYKSITFASAGNGNNENSTQKATLFKIVESQYVTYEVSDVRGYYNDVIITNSGDYTIYVMCTSFGGTLPTLVN